MLSSGWAERRFASSLEQAGTEGRNGLGRVFDFERRDAGPARKVSVSRSLHTRVGVFLSRTRRGDASETMQHGLVLIRRSVLSETSLQGWRN